jgi:FkbM family methyltransferase
MTLRWTKLLRQCYRAPEIFHCRRESSEWFTLSCAYVGLRPLHYPYTVVLRDGTTIQLQDFFDLTTFWPIFFAQTYPVDAADRVIIDAGANIGAFTLFAARAAPYAHIFSIEPFGPTFQRLREAIAANGLASRVTCFQAALGKEPGTGRMPAGEGASQFRRMTTGSSVEREVAVEVTTLGAILDQSRIERVDLLKMDIEGGEYPALLFSPPDLLRRFRRICLEYHPVAKDEVHTKERLFDHLRSAGFHCSLDRHDGGGFGIAHFRLRAEVEVKSVLRGEIRVQSAHFEDQAG